MSLTLTRRHNVDRFGYLIPTRYGNVPMVGAVATYRPGEGRFGGAVAVEEGTTNLAAGHNILVYNTDPNRWEMTLTTLSETFMGKPIVRITLKPLTDAARDHVRSSYAGHGCMHSPVFTFNANTTYTATIYWRCLKPSVQVEGSPSNIRGWGDYRTEEVVSGWKRSYAKWYDTTTRTDFKFWGIRDPLINTEETIVIDFVAPQIEAKPFATSFVDGTRAAGRLEYPAEVVPQNEGTIAGWFKMHPLDFAEYRYFWDSIGSRFAFYIRSRDKTLIARTRNSNERILGSLGSGFDETEWHQYVLTWTGLGLNAYVDGELVGSYNGTIELPLNSGNIRFGTHYSGFDERSIGLIDELLILPYAASEEEIRAWYEADGPLPSHPDALLQWDWQAVRPATMVAL